MQSASPALAPPSSTSPRPSGRPSGPPHHRREDGIRLVAEGARRVTVGLADLLRLLVAGVFVLLVVPMLLCLGLGGLGVWAGSVRTVALAGLMAYGVLSVSVGCLYRADVLLGPVLADLKAKGEGFFVVLIAVLVQGARRFVGATLGLFVVLLYGIEDVYLWMGDLSVGYRSPVEPLGPAWMGTAVNVSLYLLPLAVGVAGDAAAGRARGARAFLSDVILTATDGDLELEPSGRRTALGHRLLVAALGLLAAMTLMPTLIGFLTAVLGGGPTYGLARTLIEGPLASVSAVWADWGRAYPEAYAGRLAVAGGPWLAGLVFTLVPLGVLLLARDHKRAALRLRGPHALRPVVELAGAVVLVQGLMLISVGVRIAYAEGFVGWVWGLVSSLLIRLIGLF